MRKSRLQQCYIYCTFAKYTYIQYSRHQKSSLLVCLRSLPTVPVPFCSISVSLHSYFAELLFEPCVKQFHAANELVKVTTNAIHGVPKACVLVSTWSSLVALVSIPLLPQTFSYGMELPFRRSLYYGID